MKLKKKWSAIRDKYVREKKKQEQPSVSGANTSPVWELCSSLGFLSDHLKSRKYVFSIILLFIIK